MSAGFAILGMLIQFATNRRKRAEDDEAEDDDELYEDAENSSDYVDPKEYIPQKESKEDLQDRKTEECCPRRKRSVWMKKSSER